MNKSQLIKELYDLLSIDDDSLGQMIENAWKLSSQNAIYEYWTGLLGQSPAALDFITHFTSNSDSNTNSMKPKNASSSKAPSIQPPVRKEKDPWNTNPTPQPAKHNKPKHNRNIERTVSQLLDPPKLEQIESQKKAKMQRVENLKDVEDILKQLELNNTDSQYSVCNCMARLHPLFEVAPNCLECGKIICVKEGLRPCSSCGADLISDEEKSQIVQLLQSEKNDIETFQNNKEARQPKSKPKAQKIQYNAGAGKDFWKKTDRIFDDINKTKLQEVKVKQLQEKETEELKQQTKEIQYYENAKSMDSHLAKAKANLENLLNFQANSAERTKIIDNASDFELPTGSNLNIWSSSVEKALQLKKQQKTLREQEEKEKQISGRGKRVLDITIGKDGKAVITEATIKDEPDEKESEDIAQLERDIQKVKDVKNEQDFNTIWDYQKDAKKWEKPKYNGHIAEEGSISPESLHKTERVQFNKGGDLEEMVTII